MFTPVKQEKAHKPLAFLVERPLPDADRNLMVLHRVRLSQRTDLDAIAILPKDHSMSRSVLILMDPSQTKTVFITTDVTEYNIQKYEESIQL